MVWAVALSTMELSPHCLTRRYPRRVFVVWLGAVSSRPLTHPAPYPPASDPTAAPKGISGRTSYLRVRLVFHPYPQLIPRICNSGGCGPPRGVTRASPWPWIAHPVSGPPRATRALFRLALATAAPAPWLNLAAHGDSPVHSSIGTPSSTPPSKERGDRSLTACRSAVSVVSFTPLPGCFSPFPRGTVRYRSTQVFSLGEWSPPLPTGYLMPRGTRVHHPPSRPAVDHGALTLHGGSFQILRLAALCPATTRQSHPIMPHNPHPATPAGLTRDGFRLLPVRSPLLGESFLFLGVLRCFSSPTYRHPVYVFNRGYQAITPGELPHSGIDGALPTCGPPSLFAACRALLRPVSPRHPPRTALYVSYSRPRSSKIQIIPYMIRYITTPIHLVMYSARLKERERLV